jgi:hypothetical protein
VAHVIRPATPADAPALARVQAASWRGSYQGIVPDELLANLPQDAWQQY